MKTRTIETYQYDELSETAKEKARDWFREGQTEHYAWSAEALKSLQALAQHFGGKLKNYNIDFTGNYSPSGATFDMPELTATEIQSLIDRLGSYNAETLRGNGDCVLTGYSSDESAIDGLRRAWIIEKEIDLDKLMQAAFETWLKDCIEDCREENSDEQIAETIRANEYEFTSDGKRSLIL